MSEQSRSEEPEEPSVSPPPAGRPRREGNDSLWKRARRTLGTQNLTFLQPTSRPSGASTAAPGSGPAAPSKRREQVRHAQRTHRQRTQNYIKTLESEVVRLRESEAKLMTERDELQNQIQLLKVTIVSANLSLPLSAEDPASTSLPDPVPDFAMPATVSYATDDLEHQRLHVHWPNPAPVAQYGYDPRQQYGQVQPEVHHQHGVDRTPPDFPNDFSFEPLSVTAPARSFAAHASAADVKTSAIVDTIETAIDFVLALEHPCMHHLPYPANPPTDDPANHMMMLSTPLVARSPELPKVNSSWTASGAIIKELLNLSSSINLQGEITPVEAWHRLHQHPDFWRLDKKAIEQLKRQLSSSVRCCGFGAVLDENVFQECLHQTLATTTTGFS